MSGRNIDARHVGSVSCTANNNNTNKTDLHYTRIALPTDASCHKINTLNTELVWA